MKKLLKSVISSLGYDIHGTRFVPRPLLDPANLVALEFDHVVCRWMIERGADFRFIQIGAFDGVMADPLRKYIPRHGWRGVMVEPQAKAAAALRRLYPDGNAIAVVQAALDRRTGKRTLFTVVSQEAPAWAAGMASFDREVILKHGALLPGLEAMIHEEDVACITFDDVLARLGSPEIDLLQIDTEGADAYILSLFPFERVRPAIIHWEVKHLSRAQREDCLNRLAAHGYRFAPSGDEDMMAVRF